MPVVPPSSPQVYPSIEDVLSLARVYLNDTLGSGAGLIFTDDQPFILPLINSAIATYQRDLWNRSVPTMIREIFFFDVPPINSSSGVGVPNPAVWQVLGYTGFNDGLDYYTTPALPSDLLVPIKLWYRSSNTNLTFSEVSEAANGLQTLYQEGSLGDWEWQGNQIVWNGSINPTDIRLRYLGTVTYYPLTTPPASFPTTYIPFRDCVQALAYRVAYDFSASRTQPGGANDLLANYQQVINGIIQREVRRQQHVNYERDPYGSTGDIFGWFG